MTRTKTWRLSLAAILGFGWLFITPAYSDDPLSLAAEEIRKLNSSVNDLNYKDEFISWIDLAESKYEDASEWKTLKDLDSEEYESALQAEADALSEMNQAQSDVDAQTLMVATKLEDKNNAMDARDVANINKDNQQNIIDSAGSQGVSFEIYPLSRDGNYAYISPNNSGLICQGSISSFDIWSGSGAICGAHDNIIGIFRATVTVPSDINQVRFAGYTDDGFRLYVNGVLSSSQWIEQGSTWSPQTVWFDTSVDKTLQLEAWWYNGGGPGSMHVGMGTVAWWSGIPAEWLSYGSVATQDQIDAYNQAVANQQQAQEYYNTKSEEYNSANSLLNEYNQTLIIKTDLYEDSVDATSNSLIEKNRSIEGYTLSILDLNNAIDDAWEYYESQKQREVQIAIAQAMANQPKPEPTPEAPPTPVASPDPTPEAPPTPEPTPEAPPTPEPSPEPTPEEPPAPEPTPQPSPEPTPEEPPAPEPTVEPAPEEEPVDNPEVVDQVLEELIPEKGTGTSEDLSGVIANLTSKDNKLVVLSAEQIAAVSQTLNSLTNEAKAEVAESLGIDAKEVAVIAEAMKSNPSLATAFVEFESRSSEAGNTNMPYTLADATTEVQTEAFLSDPLGALTNIDFATVLNPSEWGKDMTDDQREKAQEVVIPVIIASNIVAAAMTRRI